MATYLVVPVRNLHLVINKYVCNVYKVTTMGRVTSLNHVLVQMVSGFIEEKIPRNRSVY